MFFWKGLQLIQGADVAFPCDVSPDQYVSLWVCVCTTASHCSTGSECVAMCEVEESLILLSQIDTCIDLAIVKVTLKLYQNLSGTF